ncbi:AAA family ATPase [Bacillus cereus]|nr:AAA family ATPase [Bacillus cereus]MDA2699063.1 AAA family ATPase [Bacillus cereus]MDA2721194.1 AAA family ATPase [Bacillus cereus]MDA2726579.1 AAA family ATPase [Bacillus cereus]
MGFSKNTILYGPPGTGKTYKVIEKAVNIINPNFLNDAPTRNDYEEAYRTYIEKKQIQFCTFHQSFSYEDFVEGLRSDIEKEGAPFTPQNGVFKEICELAKSRYQLSASPSIDIDRSKIYKISLGQANSIQGEKIYRYCIDNKVITLGHGSEIDFTKKNSFHEVSDAYSSLSTSNSSVINMVNHFKNELKIGDIVIVSKGNLKFRAIAKVTGDYFYDEETDIPYNHFRKVEWLYISSNGEIAEQILNQAYSGSSQFSQVSIYPFSEGQLNNEEIKKYITSNETSEEERFVLIIDEINRGNISKIFGELITLIEEDKRFDVEADGTIKGLEVTLPYSKDKFSVPKNVYILGTMNTADRSISLMDTALRRRFDFEEMLPEPNVLSKIDEIDVRKLLQKINQRIEYLYDRDHQIGHAFFIGKKSSDELIEVMQRKVIPLLQEYFYDDWEKIELVLGGAAKSESDKNDYFLFKQTLNANKLFNKTTKIQSKKVIYSVVKDPSTQALLNIYEDESVATDE